MRSYIEAKGLPTKRLLELALREGNSKLPVYRMHKWWARRLGSVVRAILLGLVLPEDTAEEVYWDTYSGVYESLEIKNKAGCTVLDPFMGGGSSLVEARKLGLKCVGFDIDPMAWFVTRQELSFVDPDVLYEAFEQVRQNAQAKVARFYKTRVGSSTEREVIYYFWVRTVTCPNCQGIIELHPHYQLRRNQNNRIQTCFCARCHEIRELPGDKSEFVCDSCGALTRIHKGNIDRRKVYCIHCGSVWPRSQLREAEGFIGSELVALQYLDYTSQGKLVKQLKRADELDRELFSIAELELSSAVEAFPAIQSFLNTPIPSEGREDPRPINHGFHRYAELFNARQLLCLSTILREILKIEESAVQELLLMAFSDSLASNNMMCYYAFDYDKLTPLFGLHGYNMVTRPVENNVWGTSLGRGTFRNCFTKTLKGLRHMRNSGASIFSGQLQIQGKDNNSNAATVEGQRSIATGIFESPAIDLHRASAHEIGLADHSIDVILTDPPYFDNLNYGEMSDFYYAWLRPILHERYPEEFQPSDCVVIDDRIHGNGDPNSIHDFCTGLTRIFSECKRVLKDTGILALTFHHRREEPWMALSEALIQAGFTVVQVVPVRSEGRSGFHSSPGNLKWDAVLVCRPSSVEAGLPGENEHEINYRLRQWHQDLAGLDEGPSADDWRSLELALRCLGRHIGSNKTENED